MLTLTYPITNPTSTLELRGPEFGNSDKQDFRTITREARHGAPLGHRDSAWPITKTKTFSISTSNLDTINGLKTFLSATAGLQITVLDYNDIGYIGFIVTNENEIITLKDNCSYDVSFEFMWSLQVGNVLADGILPALVGAGVTISGHASDGAGNLAALVASGISSHGGPAATGAGVLASLTASGAGIKYILHAATGAGILPSLTASGAGILATVGDIMSFEAWNVSIPVGWDLDEAGSTSKSTDSTLGLYSLSLATQSGLIFPVVERVIESAAGGSLFTALVDTRIDDDLGVYLPEPTIEVGYYIGTTWYGIVSDSETGGDTSWNELNATGSVPAGIARDLVIKLSIENGAYYLWGDTVLFDNVRLVFPTPGAGILPALTGAGVGYKKEDIWSFEVWDAGDPVGWTTAGVTTQESVMVTDGLYSCILSAPSGSNTALIYDTQEYTSGTVLTFKVDAAVYDDVLGGGWLYAELRASYWTGSAWSQLSSSTTYSTSWTTLIVQPTLPATSQIRIELLVMFPVDTADSVIFDYLHLVEAHTAIGAGTLGSLTASGVASVPFVMVADNWDQWNDGTTYYSQQFYAIVRHAPSTVQYQSSRWNGTAYVITQSWTNCSTAQSYTSDDGDDHGTVTLPNYFVYTPEIQDTYAGYQNKIKCEFRYGTTVFSTQIATW